MGKRKRSNWDNMDPQKSSAAQFITYVASTGESNEKYELRYENENIWMSQKTLAALYGVDLRTISYHITKIFKDAELSEDTCIQKYWMHLEDGRILFVAFGDRKKVSACGISYIEKLIPEVRKKQDPKVGYGEPIMQQALKAAGIETVAQYPLLNRYLDLAIPQYKIDIEVDGMAYHFDKNGCRKADDVHRDVQIDMAGWRVVRFLHCDVVNNVAACVDRVREMIGT